MDKFKTNARQKHTKTEDKTAYILIISSKHLFSLFGIPLNTEPELIAIIPKITLRSITKLK